MDYAFRYLETKKDETEKEYPYLAEVNWNIFNIILMRQ